MNTQATPSPLDALPKVKTDAYTWELPAQDWPTDFDAVPYRLAPEDEKGA